MIGDFNHATISNLAITTVIKIGSYLLPFALPIMVGGVIASLLQTGFIITAEPLKPITDCP